MMSNRYNIVAWDVFVVVTKYFSKKISFYSKCLKRAEQSEVSYQGGLKAGDVCPCVGGSVNVFMKGGN